MRERISFRKRIWRLLHPRRPVVLDGHRVAGLLEVAQHTQHNGFYLMACSMWHGKLRIRPNGQTTELGKGSTGATEDGTIILPRRFGSGPIEAEQVRQAILANWRAWLEPERVRALFDAAMKSPRHMPVSTFVRLSRQDGEEDAEDTGLFVPKADFLAGLGPGCPGAITIGNALSGTSIICNFPDGEAVEFDDRSLTVTVRGVTVAGLLSMAVALARALDVEQLVTHHARLAPEPFLFVERPCDPANPWVLRGRIWPTPTPQSELPPELRDDREPQLAS